MPSGHTPFLSIPDTLAEVVTQIWEVWGQCSCSEQARCIFVVQDIYRLCMALGSTENNFAQVEDLDYSQDSLGEVLISDRNRSCRLSKGSKKN